MTTDTQSSRSSTMSQRSNILNALSSNFLTVTLKGVGGWSPNAKIKGAETILATHFGGKDEAFKGTENILPAPYNKDFLVMTKAFNAVRSKFYDLTMPYSHTVDSKGKAQADGTRLVSARLLANGKFTNEIDQLLHELDNARAQCAAWISSSVHAIQADGVLGSRFDITRYPSSADILAGWRYEPIVPTPLADGSKLRGMSVPTSMITAIEAQMEAQATSQIRFGQQALVSDAVANIQTMARNLTSLDQWFSTQQGRRPPIYDSLVTNLQDSLAKLRTYAIPETPEGASLLTLADEIEERLDLTSMSASDFKTDHQTTRRTANEADKLAKDINRALDGLFTEGAKPGGEAPTPKGTSGHVPATKVQELVADHTPQARAEQIKSEVEPDLEDLLAEWA